jgi:LmbE family N-acetylglucosaminyl deacetylase
VKAFDPDPSIRWLFCMTHPDDELSIAAWIRRLTLQGADVFVSWTHSTPTRIEEAKAFAEAVGIPEDRLRFFDSPDGRVLEDLPRVIPLLRGAVNDIRPSRIVCGAFEQGHLDHDATNYAVSKAFDGQTFEAPFYHTYASLIQTVNRFADPTGEEVLALEPDEITQKKRFAELYPSQRIRELLVWYGVWQRLRGRSEDLCASERLRLRGPLDYLKPNLPAALSERVRRTARWKRWEQTVRTYESG